MTEKPPSLSELLEAHRDTLLRWIKSHASGLLEHESADDLVQGIHAQAIANEKLFAWRGEREFIGWLLKLAIQQVSKRHRYWTAQRRQGGLLLRLSADLSRSGAFGDGAAPAALTRGPATRAERREALSIAGRAVALLSEKDRDLVKWMSEDVALEEIARRLGVSYDAAERARLRAVERFRKAYAATQGRSG